MCRCFPRSGVLSKYISKLEESTDETVLGKAIVQENSDSSDDLGDQSGGDGSDRKAVTHSGDLGQASAATSVQGVRVVRHHISR